MYHWPKKQLIFVMEWNKLNRISFALKQSQLQLGVNENVGGREMVIMNVVFSHNSVISW